MHFTISTTYGTLDNEDVFAIARIHQHGQPQVIPPALLIAKNAMADGTLFLMELHFTVSTTHGTLDNEDVFAIAMINQHCTPHFSLRASPIVKSAVADRSVFLMAS